MKRTECKTSGPLVLPLKESTRGIARQRLILHGAYAPCQRPQTLNWATPQAHTTPARAPYDGRTRARIRHRREDEGRLAAPSACVGY